MEFSLKQCGEVARYSYHRLANIIQHSLIMAVRVKMLKLTFERSLLTPHPYQEYNLINVLSWVLGA